MRIVDNVIPMDENDIRRSVLLREIDFHVLNVLYISITRVACFDAAKDCRRASVLADQVHLTEIVCPKPCRVWTGEQLISKVCVRVSNLTKHNARKLAVTSRISIWIWLILVPFPTLVLSLSRLRWLSISDPMDTLHPRRGRFIIAFLSEI